MLSGTFIATLLVFILDKIKGKVYEFDNLDRFFNSKLIIDLSFKNKYEFDETIELIAKTKLSDLKTVFVFFMLETYTFVLTSLKQNFEEQFSDVRITLTKEINELIKFKNVILLLSKGDVTKNEFARYEKIYL